MLPAVFRRRSVRVVAALGRRGCEGAGSGRRELGQLGLDRLLDSGVTSDGRAGPRPDGRASDLVVAGGRRLDWRRDGCLEGGRLRSRCRGGGLGAWRGPLLGARRELACERRRVGRWRVRARGYARGRRPVRRQKRRRGRRGQPSRSGLRGDARARGRGGATHPRGNRLAIRRGLGVSGAGARERPRGSRDDSWRRVRETLTSRTRLSGDRDSGASGPDVGERVRSEPAGERRRMRAGRLAAGDDARAGRR